MEVNFHLFTNSRKLASKLTAYSLEKKQKTSSIGRHGVVLPQIKVKS